MENGSYGPEFLFYGLEFLALGMYTDIPLQCGRPERPGLFVSLTTKCHRNPGGRPPQAYFSEILPRGGAVAEHPATAPSEECKAFGGGLFTEIPEVLAQKRAK